MEKTIGRWYYVLGCGLGKSVEVYRGHSGFHLFIMQFSVNNYEGVGIQARRWHELLLRHYQTELPWQDPRSQMRLQPISTPLFGNNQSFGRC